MPTPTKGRRLGGSPAHQRMILANLATSLFEHGKITTTEAKARRLRPFAERLISKAKRDDLHRRRQVLRVIRDRSVVHALFTEIGPNYSTRPGGYTRTTKLGPRQGDNAAMAVIELVEPREFSAPVQPTTTTTTPAPAPTPVDDTGVDDSEPVEEQAREEEAEDAGVAGGNDDKVEDDKVEDDKVEDDKVEDAAAEDHKG